MPSFLHTASYFIILALLSDSAGSLTVHIIFIALWRCSCFKNNRSSSSYLCRAFLNHAPLLLWFGNYLLSPWYLPRTIATSPLLPCLCPSIRTLTPWWFEWPTWELWSPPMISIFFAGKKDLCCSTKGCLICIFSTLPSNRSGYSARGLKFNLTIIVVYSVRCTLCFPSILLWNICLLEILISSWNGQPLLGLLFLP